MLKLKSCSGSKQYFAKQDYENLTNCRTILHFHDYSL